MTKELKVPEKFKLWDREHKLVGKVYQTSNVRKGIHSLARMNYDIGADIRGNNFGIGDLVSYNPKWAKSPRIFRERKKGMVLDLYEYKARDYSDWKSYLADVDFEADGRKIANAEDLEALTCRRMSFDTSKYKDMENIHSFDPEKSKIYGINKVFNDPIARAIWMSYKMHHLTCEGDTKILTNASLKISKQLRKAKLPRSQIHLWFKKRFENTKLNVPSGISNEHIAFLVPYLAGEKVATYKVEEVEKITA